MRFLRVSDYLLYIRIFTSKDAALEFAAQLRPSAMLVDDKLVSMAKRVDVPIIAVERIRHKHHRRLMLLTDNLANYFRVVLQERPKRFEEEPRRSER